MTEEILVKEYDKKEIRKVWLKIILHFFAEELPKENRPERNICLATGAYALDYLKLTGQYKNQFNKRLKSFDGTKASDFANEQHLKSLRQNYEDQLVNLGRDVLDFSADKANKFKFLKLDFDEVELPPTASPIAGILRGLFFKYANDKYLRIDESKRSSMDEKAFFEKRKIILIRNASATSIEHLEGKLRKIGRIACYNDAIEFVDYRLGLFKRYRYRTLVEDLDELFKRMMIDSTTNEYNKTKTNQKTQELIREAMSTYEVWNKPEYLRDEDAFRQALIKKFDARLGRYL